MLWRSCELHAHSPQVAATYPKEEQVDHDEHVVLKDLRLHALIEQHISGDKDHSILILKRKNIP